MTTSPLFESFAPYEWSRISARGAEAHIFLQGQLSQDLANVGPDGVWSLLLSPTSEVLTSVRVLRAEGGFDLEVPREVAGAAYARLRRFLLRTECELDVEDAANGPLATVGEQVERGVAGPREFAKELTPHCFGATFVASMVSFTKGCFTGQELVGRLDARGASVPWRLVRCSGPSLERLNGALLSKGPVGGPQGVTTAINHDGGVLALGFAHRSALSEGALAEFDDVNVVEIT